MSYLLASLIAVPLLGEAKGTAKAKEMLSLYSGYISVATRISNNGQLKYQPESDFALALRGF